MRAHVDALRTSLSPLGYPVDFGFAEGRDPTAGYLVLSSPAWGDDPETPLCGESDGFQADIRVKAVAGTPDGVLAILKRVRGVLSPGRAQTSLAVPSRSATLRFVRAEIVDVDESVTITGTNRHPAFGVDTYRLTSEPT